MNKTNKNILIVDDEIKILEVVTACLENQGYQVFKAETAKQAFELFESENISLIILDLMLPETSGEELCRQIRKQSRVPIIMLTAKVDEESMLLGLEMGADDYIMKPFSLKELSARIEAVLRRSSEDLMPLFIKNSFNEGDLIVDFKQNMIKKNHQEINLTPTELKILAALIKYPRKIFTRDELIEIALGDEFEGYDRAVDSHIKNLRQKIEDNPKSPVYILTAHGKGYKFGGE